MLVIKDDGKEKRVYLEIPLIARIIIALCAFISAGILIYNYYS